MREDWPPCDEPRCDPLREPPRPCPPEPPERELPCEPPRLPDREPPCDPPDRLLDREPCELPRDPCPDELLLEDDEPLLLPLELAMNLSFLIGPDAVCGSDESCMGRRPTRTAIMRIEKQRGQIDRDRLDEL